MFPPSAPAPDWDPSGGKVYNVDNLEVYLLLPGSKRNKARYLRIKPQVTLIILALTR